MPKTLAEMRLTPVRNALVIIGTRMDPEWDGLTPDATRAAFSAANIDARIIGDGRRGISESEVIEAVARQPDESLILMRAHGIGLAEGFQVEFMEDQPPIALDRLLDAFSKASDRTHSYFIEGCGGEMSHRAFARLPAGNALATVGGLGRNSMTDRLSRSILHLSDHALTRTGVTLDRVLSQYLLYPEPDALSPRMTINRSGSWDLLEALHEKRGRALDDTSLRRIGKNLLDHVDPADRNRIDVALSGFQKTRTLRAYRYPDKQSQSSQTPQESEVRLPIHNNTIMAFLLAAESGDSPVPAPRPAMAHKARSGRQPKP